MKHEPHGKLYHHLLYELAVDKSHAKRTIYRRRDGGCSILQPEIWRARARNMAQGLIEAPFQFNNERVDGGPSPDKKPTPRKRRPNNKGGAA